MNNRLIKSNDAGGGACTNTVDLYNPFPDGGGVALYQLNGDATDVSGNYNGTPTNVTYGTGVFGQAAVFNGSSSSIDISTPPPIPATNTDCSFSCWFLNNGFNSNYKSILGGNGADALRIILVYVSTNTYKIDIARTYNNNIYYGSYVNTTILPSVWYHLTVTYSNNIAKVYLNNNLIDTINLNQSVVHNGSTSDLKLGVYRPDVSFSFWDGSIDQVRIFNRALRPYEVEALYTEEYCTPTIVPSEHFNTVTWTSTGGNTDISVTGVGFQPDLVWAKARTDAYSHTLYDSVRGAGSSHFLSSNLTNSESSLAANAAQYGYLGSFDADGFTGNAGTSDNSYFNYDTGKDYVAWNFKAGGAAVTNTDGTITSQVSANTEAGFSIVKVNTNSDGTIGHGLGKKPSIIFTKNLSRTQDWWTSVDAITGNQDDYLTLNTASAVANIGSSYPFGRATDTVFSSSTAFIGNGDVIAYCFAEVEGFSNFGSYVGTGVAGNSVVTGFEPAFIMVKSSSLARNWHIFDNKRVNGQQHYYLDPNVANAEVTSFDAIRFLENGFEFVQGDDQFNGSGASYIYMAFAADPTAVEPTLEDSFNTVTYTGNGSTQSITGVGFQPDFTWIKPRQKNYGNIIFDSVRGAHRRLFTYTTTQEGNDSPLSLISFDSNGFTVGDDGLGQYGVNGAPGSTYGGDYVAWNWKGAEIPAINSNGSIPSVVSANPAAGFSIVSYTGNGVNATIGHGLGEAPKVLIIKNRDEVENWAVGHEYMSATPWNNNMLFLNATNSVYTSIPAWGNQSPTSTTFGVGANLLTNSSGKNHIAYCFAEVAGFSKFGSYVGTGASGNFQDCGFEPAFIMFKLTSQASDWFILDNKRDTTNPRNNPLYPNLSNAEGGLGTGVNFLSNGFDFTGGSLNTTGVTFIYMAFANQF